MFMPMLHQIPDETSPSGSGVLDRIDYPTLALRHPAISESKIQVAGSQVAVYGIEEAKKESKPLSVLIVAHGKEDPQKTVKYFAQGILGEVASRDDRLKSHNLIVVTLDQRRQENASDGKQAFDPNALDIYARDGGDDRDTFNMNAREAYAQAGSDGLKGFGRSAQELIDIAQDIESSLNAIKHLIDSFPSTIEGLTVDSWAVTGISLGGFVAWKLLHDDSRIRLGIPIGGLPYESIARRLLYPGTHTLSPSLQKTLAPFVNFSLGEKAYSGKKVLTLHGKEDKIVPYAFGEDDIKLIEKWAEHDIELGGVLASSVQGNVGHVCTMQMVKMTAAWLWQYALVDPEMDDASTLVGSAMEKKKKRGSFLRKILH
ncbi:hypothetical protein IAR50_006593 [Cryptococcus sp. DSM 104548]